MKTTKMTIKQAKEEMEDIFGKPAVMPPNNIYPQGEHRFYIELKQGWLVFQNSIKRNSQGYVKDIKGNYIREWRVSDLITEEPLCGDTTKAIYNLNNHKLFLEIVECYIDYLKDVKTFTKS